MRCFAQAVSAICRRESGKHLFCFVNLSPSFSFSSYANMDYVFFSSIVGITLLVTISYDIVCQWKINLNAHIQKMPPELRPVDTAGITPFSERVSAGIPVWHAAAHEDKCRVAHSLRFLPGVGHTDGECIERGWSHMNQHSSSMKEMGQGNRHDALDDVIGNHNWEKNLAQGTFLFSVYTSCEPTLNYFCRGYPILKGDRCERRTRHSDCGLR